MIYVVAASGDKRLRDHHCVRENTLPERGEKTPAPKEGNPSTATKAMP